MLKKLGKSLYGLVCAALIVQLAGCGTLLYPERRGQSGGRVDAGVVVMDGLCLLLFIIPGVIAYVVDFSTGAIYLPAARRGSLDPNNIRQVKFDPKHYTHAAIEKIIKQETGYSVKLDRSDVTIIRLKSLDEIPARFAEILPGINDKRVALNMENGGTSRM